MRMKVWTLSPPPGDRCWWSPTVWRKVSSVESVTSCRTLLLSLCMSFSLCDWNVSRCTSLEKRSMFNFLSLLLFFSPGATPAWSWCCGGHQKILSAGSRGTRFTDTWNSKRRLRCLWPRVRLLPLTAPRAHLQTHTPLCSACPPSGAAARRRWRWNSAPRDTKTGPVV